MKSVKKIGTHSGVFHADDVTALMMLCFYTKEFQNAEIIRTRDLELLKTMDLVVDVGGEYDPKKYRFDHHQRDFEETFGPQFKTKLSGSGLIFKHFGKEVLKNSLQDLWEKDKYFAKYKTELNEQNIDLLHVKMYQNFFEYLDGIDNGISRYPKDVEALYRSNGTNLCSRISSMNPKWWSDEEVCILDLFKKSMLIAQKDYLNCLQNQYSVLFIAKSIVEQAVNKRNQIDNSGQIIFIEKSCYWKEVIYQLEQDFNIVGQIKYVIFADKNAPGFRVQAVPVQQGSFESRVPLKQEWRGLDKEKLKQVSKIDDIIFCHHSGFIGGALSFESALLMAKESLNIQ